MHGADGEVGQVYARVDAEEVEELVEHGRDGEVAEDEEAAADEHREQLHVDAEREDVGEEQRADLVRRVSLCLGEVAAHDLAHFEDVHEDQEHADVRERRGAVVLDEVEHEVDVGGRHGLHEHLEPGQDLAEDLAGCGRDRARDERDKEREHARAVRLHQTFHGVGEDVQEDIHKVVLHGDAAEKHGHKQQHAREGYESRRGAAGGDVSGAAHARKLDLAGQVQRNHAEDENHAAGQNVGEDFVGDKAAEKLQVHVEARACEEKNVGVCVLDDDGIDSARETGAHGRFEAASHLRACKWHAVNVARIYMCGTV